MQAATTDVEAFCLDGTYEAATLLAVSAGIYQVRFSDDTTRWASSADIVSPRPPVGPVPPHHIVLLPDKSGATYHRAHVVAASTTTQWKVADASGEKSVAASSVRLPLCSSSGACAEATPLAVGARVFALRGSWRGCHLLGAPSPSSSVVEE